MGDRRGPSFVLWDFNGTLVDDVDLNVYCLNSVRRSRGMAEVDLDYYLEHFSFPVIDFYRKMGFDLEREPFAAIAREWVGIYHERLWTEVRLHAGAADVLKEFQGKGLRQGILSAHEHKTLGKALEHFGIRDCLDPVLGLDDCQAGGKEELGTRWLASSGVDKDGLVLIGDTLHDFEVAQAMGIRCVLVSKGYQTRAKLETAGVPVLGDIREVPGVLS